MKTRLTKTGQPVMGTTIQVAIITPDGPYWEPCKVVAKGWGKGFGAPLIMLTVEWADGNRQSLDYQALNWREVQLIDGCDFEHPHPEHPCGRPVDA